MVNSNLTYIQACAKSLTTLCNDTIILIGDKTTPATDEAIAQFRQAIQAALAEGVTAEQAQAHLDAAEQAGEIIRGLSIAPRGTFGTARHKCSKKRKKIAPSCDEANF
jgi:hypothetical protein